MAASTPVVIASDQSAISVSAAALPLPSGAATEATLATRLADATFTGRINTQGQKTMAASTPVVLASDQSALAITAAALPLPSGAATEATLATRLADATFTGRINTQGQKTMAASTPVVLASDQASIPVTGPLTDTQLRASAVPISAATLPLPTGAAQEHTTAASPNSTRLSDGAAFYDAAKTGQLPSALVGGRLDANIGAWLGSTVPTVGSKVSASSIPVVVASDQGAIPVSQSGTWTVQPGNTANTTPWLVSSKTDLTPSAPTAASVGVASAQALASNASRKGLTMVNTSNNRISLGFGSAAVLDSGTTLFPGDAFIMDQFSFDLGAVNAIASGASSNLAIQEYA
jgi:hypothetical protein